MAAHAESEDTTVSRDTPRRASQIDGTPSDCRYLIVFEGDSSTLVQLPAQGEIIIGRSDAAGLRLHDSSVSRQHAKVLLGQGHAEIADLGSQNGTRVNGDRVVGSRALISGDVITITAATLVFHSSTRPASWRTILDFSAFRQRLEDELERSLRYQRPLSLQAVRLGLRETDKPRLLSTLAERLRRIDVLGWAGNDELLVLMAEISAEAAPAAAERLRAALGGLARKLRIGYACYPADGCEADTLLASARSAAREAAVGGTLSATKTVRTLAVGDLTILVADPAMTRLYSLIEKLAASDLPVLICGETGTGKELAASALHHWSARKNEHLVAVNCAALPDHLVESELFGYERGAFTGASATKAGLLERAHRGTIFLDEIGDLPANAQAKLLRVLEAKRLLRLGDLEEREVDIRIVASTNRDLKEEVQAGRFRQDLFFRLSAAMLWLPPLRDRRRELVILAQAFLADACARAGCAPKTLSDAATRRLALYNWPGNVRELKNLMEYVAATVAEPVLEPTHLAERLGGAPPLSDAEAFASEPPTRPFSTPYDTGNFRPLEQELRELERTRMQAALSSTGGNQTHAAELLKMPLRTFQAKLKRYHIQAPRQSGRR